MKGKGREEAVNQLELKLRDSLDLRACLTALESRIDRRHYSRCREAQTKLQVELRYIAKNEKRKNRQAEESTS